VSRLWRLPRVLAVVVSALAAPAHAQGTSPNWDNQLDAATRLVVEGRVKDGLDQLAGLFRRIDPEKDPLPYWRAGDALVEFLSQTENHALAGQILDSLHASKIPEGSPAAFRWMQVHLGRTLAHTGRADEGRKVLTALTGGDLRLVHTPAQRAAAVILSMGELDRDDVTQAAIWMRRAVVGTAIDKGAGSEEIVDVLTDYAVFLTRTRRLLEAGDLFFRLTPVHNKLFPPRSPKNLRFLTRFLLSLTSVGDAAAPTAYKALEEGVAGVDIVASSVKDGLFFQELYQVARERPGDIVDRLKAVISSHPGVAAEPRTLIYFCYFALLADDVPFADQMLAGIPAGSVLDNELSAYFTVLRSHVAARQGKFEESYALLQDGLTGIRRSHQRFENEAAGRLPTISIEERAILGATLAALATHVKSDAQANILFHVAQYLNRDKAKLGLNTQIVRRSVKSELQREATRTRDRLKDLRDRVMDEAVRTLLARALPSRAYTADHGDDYALLERLEEIEDKITRVDDQLHGNQSEFDSQRFEAPVDLADIQRRLLPNEALVMHSYTGTGRLLVSCFTSRGWTFHLPGRHSDAERQQISADERLLTAALHAGHQPSAELDASFPYESSYRQFEFLFGGLEACLRNKSLLLLATDPDLFAVPWNALLTKLPAPGTEFRHRTAAWLPSSYALSLLPSVRSLYQLRAALPASQAKQDFLGIGAPQLRGSSERTAPLELSALFASRGVANREAISRLPDLPEAADELQTIARATGTSSSRLLLGKDATERELRKQPLDDFRILSFATHAVVAGEIDGVTEPAIILSPGTDDANRGNDGLLTATEIASLKLDANLVILSACNTAAADGSISGRGLSGLADAFFFAGARALAATQWAVFSKTAKVLGSELVSRSQTGSKSVGVSEALRRTMVDYIAGAQDDHLAHPRFWAAFVVAGDGATAPLAAAGQTATMAGPITIDWEHLATSESDAEFASVANIGQSLYAMGIQKPQVGGKRAGRYLMKMVGGRAPEVAARESEVASIGVIPVGDKVGLLGFLPADNKTTAVFRLLEGDGRKIWEFQVDSPLWNFPIAILNVADGYVLISIENDYSPQKTPSSLIATRLSASGATLSQMRYAIPISVDAFSWKSVALDQTGHLIVAVAGRTKTSPTAPQMRTNPRTGSKNLCTRRETTVVFSIRPDDLRLQEQRELPDVSVVALRRRDDRVYAALSFTANCRLDRAFRLVELDPEFGLKSIVEVNNVNNLDIQDFAIAGNHFIVVGRIQVFLPTALTKEILGLERILDRKPWDETKWETGDARWNGFILVVRRDGTPVADRVFADPRQRNLSSLASLGANRFAAAGSAFGDRGWAIGFTVGEPAGAARNGLLRLFDWLQGSFRR
jgi:CHAT domain-containing protein